MNLNKYKWILGTGCSYGALVRSTFSPLDFLHTDEFKHILDKNPLPKKIHITDDYVISINVPLSGHGAEWQSDSIIYLVNFLLEEGVLSENIYCSVEWSEWFRTEEHQSYLFDLDISDFKFTKFTECYHDVRISASNYGISQSVNHKELLEILNKIEISTDESIGMSLGHIGNNIYSSVFNSDISEVETKMGYKYSHWLSELQKSNNLVTTEKKIKRYLDTILKTQWFLKSKSIQYDFITMNNQFGNWCITNEKSKVHKITDSATKLKSKKLEIVFPQFNYLITQIDFSHFWFWQDMGGIDEWVMDNFKESGYSGPLNTISPTDISFTENEMHTRIPMYGNHPNEIFYVLLWNKVSTHCNFLKVNHEVEDWILKLFNEDYNSDNPTENGLVLSKKFMEKYIK